ncbi:MAG: hypothetical protein M3292_00705 [Actinomycetota bacterium]|nr:hypothetical protein [Actinomycetota bacterium]
MRVIGVEKQAPVEALVTERRARRGGRTSSAVEAKRVPGRGAVDASALFELWAASWQAALGALEAASRAGAMTTSEAAVRRQKVAAERDVVTTELRELMDGWLVVRRLPGEPRPSPQRTGRERYEQRVDPERRPARARRRKHRRVAAIATGIDRAPTARTGARARAREERR